MVTLSSVVLLVVVLGVVALALALDTVAFVASMTGVRAGGVSGV